MASLRSPKVAKASREIVLETPFKTVAQQQLAFTQPARRSRRDPPLDRKITVQVNDVEIDELLFSFLKKLLKIDLVVLSEQPVAGKLDVGK